jgi:hypothetical protein
LDALGTIAKATQGESRMSNFESKVTEVSIMMGDLYITTVSAPDAGLDAAKDEAQVGDFHMSLFTAAEWIELSGLIETAIRQVTK